MVLFIVGSLAYASDLSKPDTVICPRMICQANYRGARDYKSYVRQVS